MESNAVQVFRAVGKRYLTINYVSVFIDLAIVLKSPSGISKNPNRKTTPTLLIADEREPSNEKLNLRLLAEIYSNRSL